MAKTNPIGVRFDMDLLEELKKDGYSDSPQRALNLLETYYKFSKIFNFKPNGRDNQFENAARGRDKNGVNNDEQEIMPEGLNWKEQLEWKRNHKK